jgi:DNA-binding NarL/FixJ family response regulator
MTEPGHRITVALADDHTLFRQGIRELLATDPAIRIVGEASTGDELLLLARRHQPDVVLLDVQMPGPGAKSLIEQIRRTHPSTAVVVLTMHEAPAVVRELLDCGAAAYLVKSIEREQLVATVHSVSHGRENVLLSVPRASLERGQGRPGILSDRELDVLRLVAKALSNKQIASLLFISEGTVKRHLTNIYAKLAATSRVDAIKKATELQLISGLDG